MDLSLASIGFGNSRINHFEHDRCDIKTRSIALNVGNDGLQRNGQGHVLIDNNFFALGGNFDMLIQNNLQKVDNFKSF
jgi:hypothetical protein